MDKPGLFEAGLRTSLRCLTAMLLLGGVTESVAQYAGPSILSRGGNLPGRRGRAPIDISFYAAVKGSAENGLIAATVDEEGQIQPVNATGVSAETGIYGGKTWKSSTFGVDYRGDYRRLFTEAPITNRFNGWNQVVALTYERTLSRRLNLQLSQTGGTTNRAFGGFAAPAFAQLGRSGVPLNEFFDVRTDFWQSNASLAYQRSARLIMTGSASAFFVKRNAFGLINSQGYSGNFSPAYRISRRTAVQALYQFQRFEFPRLFAVSNIHNMGAGIQHRVNRNWTVDVIGGMYLLNNRGTEQVQLSPEVSEILGTPVGLARFDRSSTVPMYDVSATRRQDRGSFRFGVAQTTMPGNGVFLTSTMRTANAGYSYTGIRRVSLGLSAGFSQLRSEALQLRGARFWQAGGGFSYRMSAGLNFTSQFDYRSFSTRGTQRGREGYGVTFGVAYSTSRLPLSIW